MAPEILRYEKYDAKADLWSVGAVLFEMAVGKPPFRAHNHVELLRRIEKGEDRIKFPDEAPPPTDRPSEALPVALDIKTLIRKLLKRQPVQRMGFEDFFACGIWDGYMSDAISTAGSSSILEIETVVALDTPPSLSRPGSAVSLSGRPRAPQPHSTQAALNPRPAVKPRPVLQSSPTQPAAQVMNRPSPPRKTSEPKYFVSHGATPPAPAPAAPIAAPSRPAPQTHSSSVEDASPVQPTTPASLGAPGTRGFGRIMGEGSPLAATPPMTMHKDGSITGRASDVLSAEDSMLGREYVVVEKRAVEINSLADGKLYCLLVFD
jgi:serine/threonine-protein kinase ULK/ATG1